MKKNWVTVGGLGVCIFGVVYLSAFLSGSRQFSESAAFLLVVPFLALVLLSMNTVLLHGSHEQRREFWAAMIVYLLLGVLTAAAHVLRDYGIRDKLLDAFLFGQVVAFLALLKTCFNAWGSPTRQESDEERRSRLEENKKIRSDNWR